MRAILDRFTQAEFDAEWDELRARLGDDACPTLLARTHTQRCADAVYAIFQRAAAMSPGAEPAGPVVNYVISADVFDEQLAADGRRPPRRLRSQLRAAMVDERRG